jgi:hypothetical protein
MNAESHQEINALCDRALRHNKENEHDMSSLDDIRSTYTRLVDEEENTRAKLAKAEGDLQTAREADVQAAADAALAGEPPPKRSEVRLRHAIENLGVTLAGIDAAHARLLEEAITAVGEGRRSLVHMKDGVAGEQIEDRSELDALRNFIIPLLTDDQRKAAWSANGQVAPTDLRPDDLIEFVTSAYEASDRAYEAKKEERRKAAGYRVAIGHIQEAKAEHRKRGKDLSSFAMEAYPEFVTEEDLSFLKKELGNERFDTDKGDPWPGSLQDQPTGHTSEKEAA